MANAEMDRKAAKALGFSDEEIDIIVEKREVKAFESAKSVLENCKELKDLKAKAKDFGHAVRIVVEITKNAEGKLATDPTIRVTYPTKSTTTTNGNGGRSKACKVNGKEYASFADACKAHDFPCEAISGKVVLDRALKAGKIKSFEIIE